MTIVSQVAQLNFKGYKDQKYRKKFMVKFDLVTILSAICLYPHENLHFQMRFLGINVFGSNDPSTEQLFLPETESGQLFFSITIFTKRNPNTKIRISIALFC